MNRLFLYTTSACHLCETAEALLENVLAGRNLILEKVEISDADELLARYGLRIPVIRLEGGESDLGWPFDEPQVAAFLDKRD